MRLIPAALCVLFAAAPALAAAPGATPQPANAKPAGTVGADTGQAHGGQAHGGAHKPWTQPRPARHAAHAKTLRGRP